MSLRESGPTTVPFYPFPFRRETEIPNPRDRALCMS